MRTAASSRDAEMNVQDIGLLRQQAFIGGEWVSARNGRTLEVVDPASGQHLGNVPSRPSPHGVR